MWRAGGGKAWPGTGSAFMGSPLGCRIFGQSRCSHRRLRVVASGGPRQARTGKAESGVLVWPARRGVFLGVITRHRRSELRRTPAPARVEESLHRRDVAAAVRPKGPPITTQTRDSQRWYPCVRAVDIGEGGEPVGRAERSKAPHLVRGVFGPARAVPVAEPLDSVRVWVPVRRRQRRWRRGGQQRGLACQ